MPPSRRGAAYTNRCLRVLRGVLNLAQRRHLLGEKDDRQRLRTARPTSEYSMAVHSGSRYPYQWAGAAMGSMMAVGYPPGRALRYVCEGVSERAQPCAAAPDREQIPETIQSASSATVITATLSIAWQKACACVCECWSGRE